MRGWQVTLDYLGGHNGITASLDEGGRKVRVREDLTMKSRITEIRTCYVARFEDKGKRVKESRQPPEDKEMNPPLEPPKPTNPVDKLTSVLIQVLGTSDLQNCKTLSLWQYVTAATGN